MNEQQITTPEELKAFCSSNNFDPNPKHWNFDDLQEIETALKKAGYALSSKVEYWLDQELALE